MGGLTMQQAKLHPFGHGGDVKTAGKLMALTLRK